MKSILLVYKTKTGFTKKYVDWITERITCNTIQFDQLNNVDINDYQIIIYGAGMHAGTIQGLNEFKKKVLNLIDKTIMKTYNRVLKFKNNKSKIEDETSKAISKSYDNSSSEYLKPMIDYLK